MAAKKSQGGAVTRRDFAALVANVKDRIQAAQTRAVLAANSELVRFYWDIGRIINERQKREGWGAAVIPRLALELKNELPEIKGFSERNIKLMLAFYREYRDPGEIVQAAVAQMRRTQKVPQLVAQLTSPQKVQPAVAQLPAATFESVPSLQPR